MTTDERERARFRRVLGAIGDAALPATAFDEIDSADAEPLPGDATRRGRVAVAVGLTAAATVAIAGIVFVRTGSDSVRTDTPPTVGDDRAAGPESTSDAPISAAPATENSDAAPRAATGATSPSPSAPTSATPTVTTEPAPAVEDLVRPIIDTPYCTPLWAGEWTDTEHNLFTRSRAEPTVQIIGDPSGDITAPYAVVERFFTDQRPPNLGEIHDINGSEGRAYIGRHGSGQVAWLLPDGTEAYIRSRGWGADELLQLARALSPRGADAAVPGFDVTGVLPGGAALIGETAGPLIGSGASSTCQLDGIGGHLHLAVIRGDIPYTFGVNVDWSPLPTVIQRGDDVVGIVGPPHTPATAINDVTNATPEEWEALLEAAAQLPAPPLDVPTTTGAT